MSDKVDPALDELKHAIARLVDGRGDILVGASRTGDGSKECLVLTVEPSIGPCRYLRVHSTNAVEARLRYAWLWSSYRATDARDNSDGRGLGDLQRTLDAVRHWILEGMHCDDVPEFASA